ncbi:MAG TPA: hypothetical protein VEY67_00675, partial [Candidatus Dormibacteraeota bacterium]|nr:hypothetical protein [Candidatus Dormibacteraeota bacterium]
WLHAGAETPGHHVAILEFLPTNLNVRRGDRIIWSLPGASEPHTVTFPTELNTDLIPKCEGAHDTLASPLHMPPQGPTDFTCGGGRPVDEVEFGGGNGVHTLSSPATVADSGFLLNDLEADIFGIPDAATLTHYWVRVAGPAGSYHYLCQIHGGMEPRAPSTPDRTRRHRRRPRLRVLLRKQPRDGDVEGAGTTSALSNAHSRAIPVGSGARRPS